MGKIRKVTKYIYNKAITFLYPAFCVICDDYGMPICNNCAQKLKVSIKKLASFSFAVYDYSDKNVQRVIKSIKYNNDINLAKHMSQNLSISLTEIAALSKTSNIILVPVPIHHNRLSVRGYNQSKIIAESLSRLNSTNFKIYTFDILIKHRSTVNLYKTDSISSRLEALKDSMSLDTDKLDIKLKSEQLILDELVFVIIDDVSTTGATLYEARRALSLRVKQEQIYALTLAN